MTIRPNDYVGSPRFRVKGNCEITVVQVREVQYDKDNTGKVVSRPTLDCFEDLGQAFRQAINKCREILSDKNQTVEFRDTAAYHLELYGDPHRVRQLWLRFERKAEEVITLEHHSLGTLLWNVGYYPDRIIKGVLRKVSLDENGVLSYSNGYFSEPVRGEAFISQEEALRHFIEVTRNKWPWITAIDREKIPIVDPPATTHEEHERMCAEG